MGENRPFRLWPVLAVAALAAAVAAFRGPLVSLIFEPLAWLLWAGWRLLASVDEEIWWMLLVLACAVPVVRLFDTQLRPEHMERAAGDANSNPGGRVEHWINRARRLGQGRGGRTTFRVELESLAASVAETTKLPLPAKFVRRDGPGQQTGLDGTRPSLAGRARAALVRLLPGTRRADEQALEELVNWMEVALEIKDDRHSQ